MILAAFGIPDYSPLQVSDLLTVLRMSHSIEGGVPHTVRVVDGLCVEQPVWPVVVDSIRTIPRIRTTVDRQVLFVCDCEAALSLTNVGQDLFPAHRGPEPYDKLKQVLLGASKSRGWTLSIKEPTTLEYVQSATKPSFLNIVQTEIYKISPYALRKEVQQTMISYLAGTTSYASMHKKLRSSLKFQTLSELLHLQKAKDLRDAVLMLNTLSVEAVAKSTGFEPFELLYLSRSNSKTSKK